MLLGCAVVAAIPVLPVRVALSLYVIFPFVTLHIIYLRHMAMMSALATAGPSLLQTVDPIIGIVSLITHRASTEGGTEGVSLVDKQELKLRLAPAGPKGPNWRSASFWNGRFTTLSIWPLLDSSFEFEPAHQNVVLAQKPPTLLW